MQKHSKNGAASYKNIIQIDIIIFVTGSSNFTMLLWIWKKITSFALKNETLTFINKLLKNKSFTA